MKRTLIQLDDDMWRRLREQAFRQERSISSLVRELIAQGLEGEARRRPARATQFASVGAGRSVRAGRRVDVSERHDDALAATVEK